MGPDTTIHIDDQLGNADGLVTCPFRKLHDLASIQALGPVLRIALSRKDWHSSPNGAVLSSILGLLWGPRNPAPPANRQGGASVVAAMKPHQPRQFQCRRQNQNRQNPEAQKRRFVQRSALRDAERGNCRKASGDGIQHGVPRELVASRSKSSRCCMPRRAPRLTQWRRRRVGSAIRFGDSCQGWCARNSD